MHEQMETARREDRNADAMRNLVMRTFVSLLHETNLAPITVLRHAAAAVGAVYHDVAEAHRVPGACPCGWTPDDAADIAMLQAALAREAIADPRDNLAAARVAGHA